MNPIGQNKMNGTLCPCRRTNCPRYGDCSACQTHHLEKGTSMACQRKRKKSRYAVELTERKAQTLYGLHYPSSDHSQSGDIPTLSRRLYQHLGEKPGTVLPFYVLSRDYCPDTGTFTLFVGSEIWNDRLDPEFLPEGIYASLEIRPLLGFLWGPAIGGAKRWFYSRWLPCSGYEAVNLEYELHTEKTLKRRPVLQLLFAICPADLSSNQ